MKMRKFTKILINEFHNLVDHSGTCDIKKLIKNVYEKTGIHENEFYIKLSLLKKNGEIIVGTIGDKIQICTHENAENALAYYVRELIH